MSPRVRTVILLIFIAAVGLVLYLQRCPTPAQIKLPQLEHAVRHVGIIMDGNRRWAKQQGLAAWRGHQKGTDPVRTAVEFCIEQKIPHLTLYALSVENLSRSPEELDHIYDIVEKGLTNEEFEKLVHNSVKVNIIGDRRYFPARLIPVFENLEATTKNGTALTLNILFCYGGQQEIVAAVQELGKKIEQGQLNAADITPQHIEQQLWLHESPPADLIIRTGGCNRLSNFLTWQSAYSELMFTPKYWPDITQEDLFAFVQKFNEIKRNFGK